jgi:SAM-dependent methyltransferase
MSLDICLLEAGQKKMTVEDETRNPFEAIYAEGGWNGMGSGWGSTLEYNREYLKFLEAFIKFNRIESVVDYGCGDWTFSQHMNWHGADYLGLDCVPAVIERNQQRYQRGNVRFELTSFSRFWIPACDLLIVKDVLQHLSNGLILEFLTQTRHVPFVLLVNDFAWNDPVNYDIAAGGYRPIDLCRPPFNQQGTIVFAFGDDVEDKVAFLQRNYDVK